MTTKTSKWKSQIEAWAKQHDLGQIDSYFEDPQKRCLHFDISRQYSGAEVSFAMLLDLSTILGTKGINLNSTYAASTGCSTCGHGSRYVTPISITEIT